MEILFKKSETLTGEEISLWETEFDSKRVALVNRKQEKDRILSICGDLLILKAFKSKFKDKPLLIKYTEHGKPYLKDNEFYISVSHKGNLAVCAVCDREIDLIFFSYLPETFAKMVDAFRSDNVAECKDIHIAFFLFAIMLYCC